MKISSIIYRILVFIGAGLVYYHYSSEYFSHSFSLLFKWKYALMILLFILAAITLFRFPEELKSDSGKLIFTMVYIGVSFSLALTLPLNTNPISMEIFFVFILIWLSDSFAYLIGSKFGKRKLAPKISPNKSVEGLIGGVVSTLIFGVIIEYFFSDLRGNWIIIAIIIAIFAPLGDLAESKLKRIFNVKDSGNIIPGHGGFLDRLDSFIFCVPFIFLYFLIETWL